MVVANWLANDARSLPARSFTAPALWSLAGWGVGLGGPAGGAGAQRRTAGVADLPGGPGRRRVRAYGGCAAGGSFRGGGALAIQAGLRVNERWECLQVKLVLEESATQGGFCMAERDTPCS